MQVFNEKEWKSAKIFKFVMQIFVSAMMFFGCNVGVGFLNAVPKCISMNNQECKIRPKIININSTEPLFYPYSIETNKISGSCNKLMIHIQICAFLSLLKT